MAAKGKAPAVGAASSNWLALQKTISKKASSADGPPQKRRKVDKTRSVSVAPVASTSKTTIEDDFPRNHNHTRIAQVKADEPVDYDSTERKNGESLGHLRKMIFGKVEHTSAQQAPGKYVAVDCEMVGVGIDGAESSLARVSLVNYHGYVLLDEFVRQKERVADYRTQWSGIREKDMLLAKPFNEIQAQVAEIVKDKVLIGHAIHNDLKALLLSHPGPMTRDTQHLAAKHNVVKGKRPALRNLVKQELNVTIQGGEHSSVTDARATMAVFRLHRKEWEKGIRPMPSSSQPASRKRSAEDADVDDLEEGESEKRQMPVGGRKGVSSGLSTIIKRKGASASEKPRNEWWKDLGSSKVKGTLRL
ncbi:MipD protein [Coniophora puteana RWD-64-598 SS2]|uniref:RNA exonuclease 4 n=1 Tax=Coniophora puteana (strain RWD-64-598) TaxID=741705 RepID=A0A5M3MQ35_CONPW|nr:MipD protein [Coniophora puteana RWD-64-598 SS2]EIW80671.1 MipD protein [Coniophora puteana RWD-64-598 SS2]